MNITTSELTARILEAVRKEAENQGITQGAICVAYEADKDWLGLPEDGMLSMTFPLIGDTTVYYTDDGEAGDCAGVVAMKIAAAKRAKAYYEKEHLHATTDEATSGAMPEELVGNGRTNWKGCVCYPIGVLVGGHCGKLGVECGQIYVSVSGGKQDQDEAAAWAALPVIADAVNKEYGYMLPRAYYEKLYADMPAKTDADADADSSDSPMAQALEVLTSRGSDDGSDQ